MMYVVIVLQLVTLALILASTYKMIKPKSVLRPMPDLGGKPYAKPSEKRKAKIMDDQAMFRIEQENKKR